MSDSWLKNPQETRNFMVMVADFQIANQEQKTFLKEIKKEIPLTPLYEFLHG